MFIVLMPLCFIITFLILHRYKGFIEGILGSSVFMGICVVFSTELLNKFKSINLLSILIFWSIILVFLFVIKFKFKKTQYKFEILKFLKERSKFEYFLITYILLASGILLFLCLYFPPNNADSMAYHMQRVLYWIQNSSINHYPTPSLQQLYSNPFAEFIILHLQILSGGDFFANLVQWSSMIGCIFGTAGIVSLLGGDLKSQIYSAVLLVSIPMGILQASTTQNDYVAALFIVIFVYFVLKFILIEKNKFNFLMLSIALSLAMFTKGTTYFYAFPFLIWLSFDLIRQHKLKSIKYFIACGLMVVAINAGHWTRNYEIFRSPFYPPSHSVWYSNSGFSPLLTISNISKNLYLHTITPLYGMNVASYRNTLNFNKAIGVNIYDPRIAVKIPNWEFKQTQYEIFEDTSGNPLHLLFIFISSILILKSKQTRIKKYYLAVIAGFVLFCTFVKWQPWASRLHLSFFVLSCSFIGPVINEYLSKKMSKLIAILFIVCSMPIILFNLNKPAFMAYKYHLPRVAKYFIIRGDLYSTYDIYSQIMATGRPKGCKDIGLNLGEFYYEYPLWVLIKKQIPDARIQDININNESKIKEKEFSFKPCIVIKK